jgi:peptide/nickel transport system ATP-binding protein
MALLSIEDLHVTFASQAAPVPAVRGISFEVGAGEVVALVGESGSGKSATALSLLGLAPAKVQMARGELNGRDLTRMHESDLRRLRGEVGVIFQDPLSSLNPVQKVGRQIAEAVELQTGASSRAARARAVELLGQVGIPEPTQRARDYPHQLSGGMRQRVMIAIALASSPALLIADEPTTALDVTVQAQILALIARLRAEREMGVLMITHDLGIVAGLADRVLVMYAGRIVESGPTEELFAEPRHRYTQGLLRSLPRIDTAGDAPLRWIEGAPPDPTAVPEGCAFAPRCRSATDRCRVRPELVAEAGGRAYACWHPARTLEDDALPAIAPAPAAAAPVAEGAALAVRDLDVVYGRDRRLALRRATGAVHAVDGATLRVPAGTTLGLVGESGSGKSSLGRAVVRLLRPAGGTVEIADRDIASLGDRELRPLRREFQIVFQDPQSSLNPRHEVGRILTEPLELHDIGEPGVDRARRVVELLELVGLGANMVERRPHQLSGGQRQRVGIARALAVSPQLIVLDEVVSALDVSVQAQVLALLERLQAELGIAYVFIAHDLAVVRHISDSVAVMYVGGIVEHGPADAVYRHPRHPYTAALLSAAPSPDRVERERIVLRGDPASPAARPPGCPFHTRCWLREKLGNPERCVAERPALTPTPPDPGHVAACHFSDALAEAA